MNDDQVPWFLEWSLCIFVTVLLLSMAVATAKLTWDYLKGNGDK